MYLEPSLNYLKDTFCFGIEVHGQTFTVTQLFLKTLFHFFRLTDRLTLLLTAFNNLSLTHINTHPHFQCLEIKVNENIHILFFLRLSCLAFFPRSSWEVTAHGEGAVKPTSAGQVLADSSPTSENLPGILLYCSETPCFCRLKSCETFKLYQQCTKTSFSVHFPPRTVLETLPQNPLVQQLHTDYHLQ